MGYMKVLMLLNDAEGSVDANPAGWWQECKNAFNKLWSKKRNPSGEKDPETFGFDGYSNYWQAVWQEHADVTAMIMVGRNYATVVGSSLYGEHHTEEGQIRIMKDILERKGYTIRKKSPAKSRNKA